MTQYEPRTTPYAHQATATLKAVRARSYALFMEPRTGKSKAALDAAAILHLKGEVNRVAILCPKVALEVWDEQIRLHWPYRAECEDYQFRWTRGAGRGGPAPTTRFYLLGYERAAQRRRVGRRWEYRYLAELESWDPDLIVCDESHRLKRPGGVTAQGIWRMVSRLRESHPSRNAHPPRPYVLLLSGTPTPKGPIDLFAQFRILDPSIFGTAKRQFDERYVNYSPNPRQRWRVIGYRNKRELMRRIRAHSFSVSQEAAGLARTQFTQNLSVRLPPPIRDKYNELAEYYITEINEQLIEGKNSGAVRTRLLQVTGGFTTSGVCLHRAKLETLRAYARVVLEQEEPLLVYCRFTAEVEACVDEASGVGFRSFPFQGSTSDRDRRLALRALRTRRVPACIVFQANTGSVALDLSAAAESVFYSLPDSWEAYWGDRNRVLGPHQHRPVRFTHLLASGTLDRAVLRSLQAKEEQHAAMMRNPRRYLTDLI